MRQRALFVVLVGALLAVIAPVRSAPVHTLAAPTTRPLDTLTVSLEWQPGDAEVFGGAGGELQAAGCATQGDKSYLDDLSRGLREMAGYIYSYTGGRIKLRDITVYTGGAQWEQADIRILANRSYRPTAFVGGNVLAPEPFYGGDATPRTVFAPAPILLGRLWNGQGARCGAWSEPEGWRTLGHEWAHYALRLYDEYMNQFTSGEQYCNSDQPGFSLLHGARAPGKVGGAVQSLMAYHYTADQLSQWDAGRAPLPCRNTPHATVYGESNWATITRFFGFGPPADPSAVPPFDQSGLNVNIVAPAGPTQTSADVSLDALPVETLPGQAYLIRPDPKQGGAPAQIIGQGNIVAGEAQPMRFWGVQPRVGDRPAVLVQDPLHSALFAYPPDYRNPTSALTLTTELPNKLAVSLARWQPSISITPRLLLAPGQISGEVTGLHVRLKECTAKQLERVQFVYCPAGGSCTPPVTGTVAVDGAWEYTFDFPRGSSPALHGYIYAREPFRGAEAVTWYQLAGGVGPAHTGGLAPMADGPLNVDLPQNVPSAPDKDNRVLYSPALACTARQTLPPGVLRLVDAPLRVTTVIGGPNGGQPWISPALRVRLSYDQDLLTRLGLNEQQLIVLQLDKRGQWQPLRTLARSSALDWIAAPLQPDDDGSAVVALGYGPSRTLLPFVRR